MNKTELREIINNGENSGVEFKRDVEDNRALAKELVAFANLQGGRVLLGVEKDRTVFGLTRFDPGTGTGDTPRTYDRLEEWIMQACRDKIRPEIIPDFEVIRDVEPGLDVAAVEIERGWSAHHLWHNQHRTYYIRVGSLSRGGEPRRTRAALSATWGVSPEDSTGFPDPRSTTSTGVVSPITSAASVRSLSLPTSRPRNGVSEPKQNPGARTRAAGVRSSISGYESGERSNAGYGNRSWSDTGGSSTAANGIRPPSLASCCLERTPNDIFPSLASTPPRMTVLRRTMPPASAHRCETTDGRATCC